MRYRCAKHCLHGIIPVIPISDPKTVGSLADHVKRESQRGNLSAKETIHSMETFHKFPKSEMARLRDTNPFY